MVRVNERGSGTVEATVVVGLALVLMGTLVHLGRGIAARLWFEHCLYGALVCVSEGRSNQTCTNEAHLKASKVPLGADQIQVDLQWLHGHWEGKIRWQGFGAWTGRVHLKMALPSWESSSLFP